jgi:hypothetical protein
MPPVRRRRRITPGVRLSSRGRPSAAGTPSAGPGDPVVPDRTAPLAHLRSSDLLILCCPAYSFRTPHRRNRDGANWNIRWPGGSSDLPVLRTSGASICSIEPWMRGRMMLLNCLLSASAEPRCVRPVHSRPCGRCFPPGRDAGKKSRKGDSSHYGCNHLQPLHRRAGGPT